jgi:hypothetical protein
VRAIVPASTFLLALALGACGEEPAEDPAAVVAHAARATFDGAPRAFSLAIASPDARWAGSGAVELARGRFRLVAKARPGVLVGPRRQTVVGTSGEGYETTFAVFHGELFGEKIDQRRCWFNPHLPVGSSHDAPSVEESVRLTGSVVESLRHEIGQATNTGADAYEVTLAPSATRPRDDFHETERRVWGDRELLALLDEPIGVTVSERGTLRSIDLRLGDYSPEILQRRSTPHRVSLHAALSASSRELELQPPGCQALE